MPAHDDQRSVRKADREPSVARATAADLADELRDVARPLVDDTLGRLSFMLLVVLMVPVGIFIVALGFAAMALSYSVLGAPTGVLASMITIAGLLGILDALFFSFRAMYRRMPRRLVAAYAKPMRPAAPDPARAAVTFASDATPGETAPPGGLASTSVPSADAPLDARLDFLVAKGGEMSFSYSPRHKLRLSLRRQGPGLKVTGSIDTSRLLDEGIGPSTGDDEQSAIATNDALVVRRAALEEAGWKLDQRRVLSRSWAIDSVADRERLGHEVDETITILDTGTGDAQRMRNWSELEQTIEVFSSLFVSAAGAAVGALAGIFVLLLLGSGTGSWLSAVLGFAVGVVAGAIAGLLCLSHVVKGADRLPWFRGRLELVWLAAAVLSAGLTAFVVTTLIARI